MDDSDGDESPYHSAAYDSVSDAVDEVCSRVMQRSTRSLDVGDDATAATQGRRARSDAVARPRRGSSVSNGGDGVDGRIGGVGDGGVNAAAEGGESPRSAARGSVGDPGSHVSDRRADEAPASQSRRSGKAARRRRRRRSKARPNTDGDWPSRPSATEEMLAVDADADFGPYDFAVLNDVGGGGGGAGARGAAPAAAPARRRGPTAAGGRTGVPLPALRPTSSQQGEQGDYQCGLKFSEGRSTGNSAHCRPVGMAACSRCN
jgi:hypothetical protein